MYSRHLHATIERSFEDTPVVLLVGPRQAGKSTLARELALSHAKSTYRTLDDPATLAAAQRDPATFLGGGNHLAIIDEVQRVPDLLVAVKSSVDEHRRPGRFLLTGSANVFLMPNIADSLVGRAEAHTLWPLSQGEIDGTRDSFVSLLFTGNPKFEDASESRVKIAQRILRGGFPEPVGRKDPDRRRAWFESYLETLLRQDVRELSSISDLSALPRLMRLLAASTTGLLNFADLSRTLGIPQSTLTRYFALLETTYLVQTLPAWYANLGKRLVKAPKIHLVDSGLAGMLTGFDDPDALAESPQFGPLLENFVACELRKQLGWNPGSLRLFHFRSHAGAEVDFVLENGKGELAAVEVKATATVRAEDFKGLDSFAESVKSRFRFGVLLHLGKESVPFGKKLVAAPIANLWRT